MERIKMSAITTIRLSIPERRYARALSKRNGCKLKEGSAAYIFKYWLHKMAEKEKIPLK
jgi:hypothetical protein